MARVAEVLEAPDRVVVLKLLELVELLKLLGADHGGVLVAGSGARVSRVGWSVARAPSNALMLTGGLDLVQARRGGRDVKEGRE